LIFNLSFRIQQKEVTGTKMLKRRLGDSTLEISEVSFGTWLTVAGGIERQ